MIAALHATLAAALLLAPAEPPPVQRPEPTKVEPKSPPAGEATDVTSTPAEEPSSAETTDLAVGEAAGEATDGLTGESMDESTSEASAEDASSLDEASAEDASGGGDEVLHVATERAGPPYYTESDLVELRERHGVEAESPPAPPAARWHCLIADPTCRHTFELQAMGGYALRARQGDVSRGTVDRWNSARAQYDFWVGLPALVETVGKSRFTRMSLGPKGGVAFSDTGDLWGNLGIATRYWLGRGRWAPSIELTSALSFKMATRVPRSDADPEEFRMQRGPVGFQADVGFGIGGFGAIVLGGQYDSPLAREDIPEEYREVASGMFYVGFRGNILWGGPAAVAVAAHASTRAANRP